MTATDNRTASWTDLDESAFTRIRQRLSRHAIHHDRNGLRWSEALSVQVVINKQYVPIISTFPTIKLRASSTAKMSGSMPLCLLGLDPSAPQTIGLEQSALLTAPGCLVQSNSTSATGVKAKNDLVMQAGMICSAGGKVQTSNANFSPAPTTDCPVLADPLGLVPRRLSAPAIIPMRLSTAYRRL